MANRKIGVAISMGLLAALVTGACSIPEMLRSQRVPKELQKARVVVSELPLKKTGLVNETALKGGVGTITDIAVDPESHGLFVAGTRGAAALSGHGQVESTTPFRARVDRVTLVSDPDGGKYRYLNRGSWAIPASLLGGSGEKLWAVSAKSGTDDTAAGDIDGDGRVDFVVGFNGGGGVSLLDGEGKEIWNQKDSNVWHVEILAPDKKGRRRIVHSNAKGKMTIRDQEGKVLTSCSMPVYFSDFSLWRPTEKPEEECVLTCAEDTIWLIDLAGKPVKKLGAPLSKSMRTVSAVPVRLKPDGPPYMAALAHPQVPFWNSSVLYVYDEDDRLVYQEVLPETCMSVAVVPGAGSDPDTLLLGGSNQVWAYGPGTAPSPE